MKAFAFLRLSERASIYYVISRAKIKHRQTTYLRWLTAYWARIPFRSTYVNQLFPHIIRWLLRKSIIRTRQFGTKETLLSTIPTYRTPSCLMLWRPGLCSEHRREDCREGCAVQHAPHLCLYNARRTSVAKSIVVGCWYLGEIAN